MVLRRIVLPLLAAYAVFLGVFWNAMRHPAPRTTGATRRDGARWPEVLRHVAFTAAGGYVCFLAIVLVFHVWIAGQRGALASAVWGGAFLCAVAMPVFMVLSLVAGRGR